MTYIPTAAEQRAFRSLLRTRTPLPATFRDYRERANRWIVSALILPPTIQISAHSTVVRSTEMRPSVLFKRDYVVAYVDDAWLRQVAPKCDAMAASIVQSGKPPLVLVPARSARKRGEKFQSILEHEFVHINQMLLGVFPVDETPRTSEALLRDFWVSTQMEYEANVLQLTRWPSLYPRSLGLSLDRWCVLRGYSQSLEAAVAKIGVQKIPRREAIRFLRTLPSGLRRGFEAIGIDQGHGPWFQERWGFHLAVALQQVAQEKPSLKEVEVFRAMAFWTKT